jgi:hypothetical protein
MSRLPVLLSVGTLGVAASLAATIDVPLDPAQSALNFELCVSGQCDTDSSSVTGTITIDLDLIDTPTQISLYNFDLYFTSDLHWYLSWGFVGNLTADAAGVALHYAYPGTPLGPAAITSGSFGFVGVPTTSDGLITYSATGIPCFALQGAGLPCNGAGSLADQGVRNADQFAGTITSQNRLVTLTSQIDMTMPLDPNNPTLGTLHVYGSTHGQVIVPLAGKPGDLNCDSVVDFKDINPFVLALTGQPQYEAAFPACRWLNADCNNDGMVDFRDINAFVALLSGT